VFCATKHGKKDSNTYPTDQEVAGAKLGLLEDIPGKEQTVQTVSEEQL